MEYYDNTPAKLNIKLRDIPLDRTTNSQYKVIYGGLNETLPKMENEFSNLKIRVKEYNKSRNSSPENSDLINNNILYTQQNNIKINQVKTLNDNNNITNNNNNLDNNNNIIITGNYGYENSNENIFKTKNKNNNNINNNYDKMSFETLEKILENKNTLIDDFNKLVESCYEKLKRYKEENINLKKEMEKFGFKQNEIIGENNDDEDEKEEKNNENNEKDFNSNDLPTLKKEKKFLKSKKKKSNTLESNNNNYLNNINLYGLKQIQHLGEELNEIMIDNKNSQEKYENKLGNLINKLQNLGNKFN